MIRRLVSLSVALAILLSPTGVAAIADSSPQDDGQWEVIAEFRSLQTIPDPFTGKDLLLEGTRTILRWATESDGTRSNCYVNKWHGEPYVNVGYGDAYAMAHSYVSVSSGCTGGVAWYQYLEEKNILGYFIQKDSDRGSAPVGGHDYTTVSERCDSSTTRDWRSKWTHSPVYTSVASLTCDG